MQVEKEIIKQAEITIDFEEKIKKLPYRFVDAHKLDKKLMSKNYNTAQK
ncbi:MAG: hypothetical protein FWF52_03220 [Candidatus Azobacteroides sp.]|nr:hypothetical protein [Candidatus Azobacteroides sp.]